MSYPFMPMHQQQQQLHHLHQQQQPLMPLYHGYYDDSTTTNLPADSSLMNFVDPSYSHHNSIFLSVADDDTTLLMDAVSTATPITPSFCDPRALLSMPAYNASIPSPSPTPPINYSISAKRPFESVASEEEVDESELRSRPQLRLDFDLDPSSTLALQSPPVSPAESDVESLLEEQDAAASANIEEPVVEPIASENESHSHSHDSPSPSSSSCCQPSSSTPAAQATASVASSPESESVSSPESVAEPSTPIEESSDDSETKSKKAYRRGRKPTDDSSKSFVCEDCNRRFRRQEHLKRHYRSLHTREKPFECHECSKKFSRSDNLAQHARTHNRSSSSTASSSVETSSEPLTRRRTSKK